MTGSVPLCSKADLLTDAAAGQRVVAGDHDDADTGVVAGMDGSRHFRPHRIGQCYEAQKNQSGFNFDACERCAVQFGAVAIGEAEDA